jgi:hypothetical protein
LKTHFAVVAMPAACQQIFGFWISDFGLGELQAESVNFINESVHQLSAASGGVYP